MEYQFSTFLYLLVKCYLLVGRDKTLGQITHHVFSAIFYSADTKPY